MSFPFTQLLVNSLIIGSIYALVACGFSLIYATNRFIHFAHGSAIALAAYLAYSFSVKMGLPFSLTIVLTIIVTALFGAFMYRFVYVPLQNRNSSNVILLIASVALLLLIENLILLFYGADVKSFTQFGIPKTLSFAGATLTVLQLTIICVVLVS